MIRSRLVRTTLFAMITATAACGDDKPEAKTAANVDKKGDSKRLPDKAPDSPTAAAVHISPEIIKACGISESDAYFAFDSANLRDDDIRVLGTIAKCFNTGPLAGRSLSLVGHTDMRGSAEYNDTLGQSRADSVGAFLVGQGKMDKAKVGATTRGEMDAMGTDEPGWAKDRRVDILLVK